MSRKGGKISTSEMLQIADKLRYIEFRGPPAHVFRCLRRGTMSSEESSGFIEGGERYFLKELAEEEQKMLAPLKERLKETRNVSDTAASINGTRSNLVSPDTNLVLSWPPTTLVKTQEPNSYLMECHKKM